jgi:hypothetical protein
VENLTIDEQGGLNSARSARATSTGGTPAYAELDLAQPATDLYVQAAVMLRTQANNPVALMRFRSAAGDLLVTLYLSNTGRLGLQFGNNASTTGNVRLDPGRWNEIELHIRVADGRTTVEVWFNGSYLDDLYLTTTLAARPVETVPSITMTSIGPLLANGCVAPPGASSICVVVIRAGESGRVM